MPPCTNPSNNRQGFETATPFTDLSDQQLGHLLSIPQIDPWYYKVLYLSVSMCLSYGVWSLFHLCVLATASRCLSCGAIKVSLVGFT